MFRFFDYVNWFVKAFIQRKSSPFCSVIYIGNKSNRDIFEELKYCYKAGSRIVRFAGNVLEWTSDSFRFNDIVARAKKMGFHSVEAFWNGIEKLDTKADIVWFYPNSEQLELFFRNSENKDSNLIKYIANWNKKNINILYQIDKFNYTKIEDLLKFCAGNPNIQSVAFSFCSSISMQNLLSNDLKYLIIDKLIEFKHSGYPVYNSFGALFYERKSEVLLPRYSIIYIDNEGTKSLIPTYSPLRPVFIPTDQ